MLNMIGQTRMRVRVAWCRDKWKGLTCVKFVFFCVESTLYIYSSQYM